MKNMLFDSITAADILASDKRVVEVWQRHLSSFEVPLPQRGTASRVWLCILMLLFDRFTGLWIHKDDVSELTQRVLPEVGQDQQVRHLKEKGWPVEGDNRGNHRIRDPFRPSALWETKRNRKQAMKSGDFDDLVRAFGNRCATCGALAGEPDRRYGSDNVVRLQQGHRDPELPLSGENCIPQCQHCNRGYRDDFVFDEKGRVHAVAGVRPVRRASATVRRKILEFLKGER